MSAAAAPAVPVGAILESIDAVLHGIRGMDADTKAIHIGRLSEARKAVERMEKALDLAQQTIAGSVSARGYQFGTCTDEWEPAARAEVATLAHLVALRAKA